MRLEKIEKATAKTGAGYLKLTIDGKNYNYFGELGDVKEGDFVVCEFETKGKFTNMKNISKSTENASPQASNAQNSGSSEEWVFNVSVKPNSFEWGKATSRHKVYYDDPAELKAHIEALKELGLYEDEIIETQKFN